MTTQIHPETGLPEGVSPSDVKGLSDEGFVSLKTAIVGAIRPEIAGAVKSALEEYLKERKQTPSVPDIAKNGADTPIAKEALIGEYAMHRFVPNYAMRSPFAADFESVVKAMAALCTPQMVAKAAGIPAGIVTKTALTTTTANAGAELVMTEYVRELIESFPNIAGFSQDVTVRTMSENAMDLGKITGKPTAAYKTQNVAATPSATATDNIVLVAKTLVSLTEQFSVEVATDARNNFLQDMARYLGEADALEKQRVFCVGNNTSEPQGIDDIDAGREVSMDGATMDAGDVVSLIGGVMVRHRVGAGFWANNAIITGLRKLRDTNGRFLFVDPMGALPGGLAGTLLGFPVRELPDIDGSGTVSSPGRLYFGNGKRFYTWGDRKLLEIASSIDGSNFAAYSMQLRGVTRNDGKITLDEAMAFMDVTLP